MANRTDKIALSLDEFPIGALYRVAVGFAAVSIWAALSAARYPAWTIIPFLLLVLFFLRLIPAIVRRFLPVSADVKRIWAERRETGRRYDSCQWRKLLWIGLGVLIYMATYRDLRSALIFVAMVCLVGGFTGLSIFINVQRTRNLQ